MAIKALTVPVVKKKIVKFTQNVLI